MDKLARYVSSKKRVMKHTSKIVNHFLWSRDDYATYRRCSIKMNVGLELYFHYSILLGIVLCLGIVLIQCIGIFHYYSLSIDILWYLRRRFIHVLQIPIIFWSSVVLHELGHAIAARCVGKTKEDLFIGISFPYSFCYHGEIPRNLSAGIVALSGIAMNLIIAAFASMVDFSYLAEFNLLLALFQLGGAPLDGGMTVFYFCSEFIKNTKRAEHVALIITLCMHGIMLSILFMKGEFILSVIYVIEIFIVAVA
jgi:hypothetical protein